MYPSSAAFAQAASGKPRFLAIYQPNGHHQSMYHPSGMGRDLSFQGQMSAPLEPWMSQVTLFKDMLGVHTGGQGNGHLLGITSWLTGAMIADDKQLTHKISLDTALAEHYAKTAPNGRTQQLVLAGSGFLDPGRSDMGYNNEQKDWISTAANGEKIPAEIDVEAVFKRILMGTDAAAAPAAPADNSLMEARLALRKSALDFVKVGQTRLEQRLGMSDRAAVEQYLTSIRELEVRLSVAPGGAGAPQCTVPTYSMKRKWPNARMADMKNEYIDEHWQDTMRLLAIAFQCEAVRSVAYMLETEAGESGYANHGLPNSHGTAHGVNAQYAQRDNLHATLMAEMFTIFKETSVGGGTLLDQTMIYFGGGQGENHSSDRITGVLAGFRGTGKHIPQIQHGALHDFANQKNQHDLIRTMALHLEVITPDQGFGDAGPTDQVDLSV
ncbi:MAG: hypothetical protein RJA70_2776 [Pseudomonadota bacterium]|jgi:hypothetical protein